MVEENGWNKGEIGKDYHYYVNTIDSQSNDKSTKKVILPGDIYIYKRKCVNQ